MADSFQTLIDDDDEPVDRYDAYNNNFSYHRHPREQSATIHNQTTSNADNNHGPGLDDSSGLMWKNQLLFASPSPTLSFSSSASAISSSYFRSSSSGVDLTASPNIDEARRRQYDRPAPSTVHRTPLFGVDQSPWTTSTTSTTTSTTKLQRHHHKAEVVDANAGKTPRLRTVLNEHHLRVLRSCYAVTPRPDQATKDKLEQMTGLTPRVIRVWFQNKRCKDKKRPHALLSRR